MSDTSETPHDWAAWRARRSQGAEALDEAAVQERITRWEALLADEAALPDEVLDRELAELLVRIHRAC